MPDRAEPATPAPIPFITDDGILRRVAMIENGLSHLEVMIPSMIRELAAIRQALEPRAGDGE